MPVITAVLGDHGWPRADAIAAAIETIAAATTRVEETTHTGVPILLDRYAALRQDD